MSSWCQFNQQSRTERSRKGCKEVKAIMSHGTLSHNHCQRFDLDSIWQKQNENTKLNANGTTYSPIPSSNLIPLEQYGPPKQSSQTLSRRIDLSSRKVDCLQVRTVLLQTENESPIYIFFVTASKVTILIVNKYYSFFQSIIFPILYYTNQKNILKFRNVKHYFVNFTIPINHLKSNNCICLFLKEWDIKGKLEHLIEIDYRYSNWKTVFCSIQYKNLVK